MTQLVNLHKARMIRRQVWLDRAVFAVFFVGAIVALVAAFMAGHAMGVSELIGACQ